MMKKAMGAAGTNVAAKKKQIPDHVMAMAPGPALDAWNYWVDASQRAVLFLDVMRQRTEQYQEHAAKAAPHVLKFACDLVMDGRQLPRPVNYALVRVHPGAGTEIDPIKRPFVVFDQRAGHGPGIGGFKPDSEIGVALKAGHPCYFVGFLPEPMPGQTIESIARAEAQFIEKVTALHPDAQGKPCVIGNCQAGWAVMMLASMRPELFGPIIIAGSPLSYWTGQRGLNPMRYSGGLLGGTWLTAFAGDIGNGTFDGAWLVQNFEYLNPANTYWKKHYNLFSKVDTEPPQYLDFERWWGGHVNLTAKEMQSIADELFVGNGHVNDNRDLGDDFEMIPQLFAWQGKRWRDCTAEAGEFFERKLLVRGVASGDFDSDGDVDLLVVPQNAPVVLLENLSPLGNWLKLEFVGRQSNRRGIGTRVTAQCGELRILQELAGGTSYCASNQPALFFGLGSWSGPVDLEVRWPGGVTQTLCDVRPNRTHFLLEPLPGERRNAQSDAAGGP
jgi:hypothetical protein